MMDGSIVQVMTVSHRMIRKRERELRFSSRRGPMERSWPWPSPGAVDDVGQLNALPPPTVWVMRGEEKLGQQGFHCANNYSSIV